MRNRNVRVRGKRELFVVIASSRETIRSIYVTSFKWFYIRVYSILNTSCFVDVKLTYN